MQNTKLGTVSYNPGNCKRQEDPQLHIQLEDSLAYMKPYLKNENLAHNLFYQNVCSLFVSLIP